MSFRSVRGPAGPWVPPAAPVWLVEGGWGVCASPPGHVRRALFAGRFPRTLPKGSPSLASGIPGGSLVVAPQACPLAQELPTGPVAGGALLREALSAPGFCRRGEARPILGGARPPSPQPLPHEPCWQIHLVPGAAVGLLLRFPCERVFLIFHCFPQLIELNL